MPQEPWLGGEPAVGVSASEKVQEIFESQLREIV
jgi:hypothetical protein